MNKKPSFSVFHLFKGFAVWLLLFVVLPSQVTSQCITRSANARCDTIIPLITCVSGSPICFESVATIHLQSGILVDTVCVSFGDGQDTTFVPPDTSFNITHYYHFFPEDSCTAWNNGEPGINCDIRANFFKRCPLGYSYNYSLTSVSFRFRPRADLNLQHAEYCTTDSALILDYGCTNTYLQTDYTDYWWDYGDGTPGDTVWDTQYMAFSSFPHQYTNAGTYYLTLHAQNECGIDSDRLIIDTYTMTDIQLSTPVPICTGDTIRAHINGIGSSNVYRTELVPPTPDVRLFNDTTPDPVLIFSKKGSYTISFHFGTCTIDTTIIVDARVDLTQGSIPDLCDNGNGNNPLVLSDYYQSAAGPEQTNHFWIRNNNGVVYQDASSAFLSATVNLPDTGLYVITDTSVTICNTVYFRDSFYLIPRVTLVLPPDTTVCLQSIYVLPVFPATTITLAGNQILNDTILIDTAKAYAFVYQPSCGNSDTLTITGEGFTIQAYDSFYCARPGNITLTGSITNIVFSGNYVSSPLGIMYGDSSNSVLNPFYAAYTDPATGCIFRDSAIITIAPPLNSAYTLTDTACINSTVYFNKSDTTLSYSINWGDGTIDDSTTHTYFFPGTKQVAITLADSVCTEVHSDSVVVLAPPPAFFSLAPDTLCYGDTSFITFTSNPQYVSTWTYAGVTTNNPPLIVDTSSVNRFLTVPVTLSVYSDYCPVVNYTDNVYFNRAVLPVVALNYDSTCSPLAITIINNSALYPAADFYWYKNDVLFSTSSALQQVDTLYADQHDSAYTFKLVVFSCNRYDSASQTVVVHQANFAPALYVDTFHNCVFEPFEFSASVLPNCVVTYNYGDGSFSQPIPSDSVVTHAYDSAGDYTVNLTMFCECKIKSDNLVVHVYPGPILAASAPPIGCADSLITITSQNTGSISAGAYYTYFGDGAYDLLASYPTHAYTTPGTYKGWLGAAGINGCRSDTARFDVMVYKTPSAYLPPLDTVSCLAVLTNLSVDTVFSNSTYEWSILYNNQITSATTFNGTFQFYAPDTGVHFVFLSAYANGNHSCIAYSDTVSVTILPSPVLSVNVPSVGCADSVLTINSQNTGAVPIGIYHTYFGDGLYDLFSANPVHVYTAPGTYNGWMVAQGTNGCPSDTSYFDVLIYETPSAQMPPIDTSACAGIQTLFSVDTVFANSVYEWSILHNGSVTSVTTYDGTLPLYAEDAGEHLLFLTAYNANHTSCVAYSDTFRVTVYPAPDAQFAVGVPYVTSSVFSFPLRNYSSPADNTYIWDFGDNTFSFETNPVPHGYTQPGTYFITLTARNGPCEDSITHPVVVDPYLQLFVPNVFSANADGNNDYFQIFGNLNDVDYLHVKILDRSGEKVFDSFDINFKWDGTYKGTKLNPAVFVYLIEVSGISDDEIRLMKGSVTLVR